MDELIAWLREQIAEDRRIAEAVANSWPSEPPNYEWETKVGRLEDAGWKPEHVALLDRHVVQHDPRDVIAQCEANEAMIRYALEPDDKGDQDEYLLRLMTLAYRHRPGYRREWRP